MVSGNAFGLEFVIRIVHIFENTDLKNVVLVVGIMAVDFDCAWGAFTQLQWIRVDKCFRPGPVGHLRSCNGLKMFSGGACGARQLAACILEIARYSNS